MGYHDRDQDPPQPPEPEPPLALSQQLLGALVRTIGVIVLAVGVWAGVKVILEAWALYEQPARIERLAAAVQAGSNIDGVVGDLAAAGEDEARPATAPTPRPGLRLSYFAAWLIALLLMFAIGSLAMAAIATGGQLALFDLQVRRHSRAVLREVRKLRRRAA